MLFYTKLHGLNSIQKQKPDESELSERVVNGLSALKDSGLVLKGDCYNRKYISHLYPK